MATRTITRRLVIPGPARIIRPISTSRPIPFPHASLPLTSSTTATQPHPHPPSSSFHPPRSSIFTPLDTFLPRHVGPTESDVSEMLSTLGFKTMEDFISATIPTNVRIDELTDDESKGIRPMSELELRRRAEEVAGMNKGMKSYIGMG